MEPMLAELAKLGFSGALLAVVIYDVFFLQKKLISIIESNTIAMEKLKLIIEELKK